MIVKTHRMKLSFRPAVAIILVALFATTARTEEVFPLHALYLGNAGTQRAEAFERFLRKHFAEVTASDRDTFDPASAGGVDVALLDWSQRDTNSWSAASPIGPRDDWKLPTVLLGSAGHLLASPWQIIGGSG